jgi:hypothetical protein
LIIPMCSPALQTFPIGAVCKCVSAATNGHDSTDLARPRPHAMAESSDCRAVSPHTEHIVQCEVPYVLQI